jgi:hypothetical protein
MKDGRTLAVVLNAETDAAYEVELLVKGPKGQTTGASKMTVAKSEVASLQKMSDEGRARLKARLAEFRTRKRRLADALAQIKTEPASVGSARGRKTIGANFEILSTCEDPFLKEATFYLEEIFTAYQGFFNIQRNAQTKITVYLLNDLNEYVEFQRRLFGGAVMNPALYAPQKNIIVAYNMVQKEEAADANASIREFNARIESLKKELTAEERRIDAAVKEARKQVAAQAADLRKQIAQSDAANKGRLRDEVNRQERQINAQLKEQEKVYDQQLAELRRACTAKVEENNKLILQNQQILASQNRRMFETLFHEGFHAFVANYLFERSDTVEVPRWINEGMAMYFEMSVVEAGELIHGGLQKELLKTLQEKAKGGGLVPLRKVLLGGPEQFLVTHEKEGDRSTLYYAESWALAHYLTGRVAREALEKYVADVLKGAAKDKAFETMMGKSVEAVEADWVEHVKKLK